MSAHEQKQRVHIVANGFSGGGAETVAVMMALALAKANYDVTAYRILSDSELGLLKGRIKTVDLQTRTPKGGSAKLLAAIRAGRRLRRTIGPAAGHEPVISHLALSDLTCAIAGCKQRICVIHSVRSLEPEGWLEHILLNFVYRKAQIVAVAHGVARDFLQYYNVDDRAVRVLYNPIDAIELSNSASRAPDRLHGDYIVHVGRMVPLKRHADLIDAFSKIEGDVRLVLVGDGPERQRLEEKVRNLGMQNRVDFCGWQNNPSPYVAGARMLVLCSEREGLPTVLVEALLMHVPVVSSDCLSGPSEILLGRLRRYLYEVGNVDALRAAIEEVLQQGSNYPFEDAQLDRFSPARYVEGLRAVLK